MEEMKLSDVKRLWRNIIIGEIVIGIIVLVVLVFIIIYLGVIYSRGEPEFEIFSSRRRDPGIFTEPAITIIKTGNIASKIVKKRVEKPTPAEPTVSLDKYYLRNNRSLRCPHGT